MKPLVISAFAIAALTAGGAHAGRSCEALAPATATVVRGLVLAERTHAALEAEHGRAGTQVVVLARAGQDLGRYGLRYSHLGFAYRTRDDAGAPVWRVLHKLNQCGTADSALYRQGLGEFFLDDLWRHEAAWVTLAPAVQDRLWPLLQAGQVDRLHQRRYSIVSYAWSTRYQQSNQWAIEVLAGAMDDRIATREQAQAWLMRKDYRPTTLHVGAFKRLGARITAANVAFDDHPDAKRFADRIETVTVDSVFDWLRRAQLGAPAVALRL